MKKTLIAAMGLLAFAATANAQVGVTMVEPAPSAQSFDYTSYKDVQVFFNTQIQYDEATISYGDVTQPMAKFLYSDVIRNFDCIQLFVAYPELEQNFVQEALNAGATSFTVTLTGVKSSDGGVPVTQNLTKDDLVKVDNGTVTVTYNLEQAPRYLPEESKWPNIFYRYWEPGNPDAIATLVFDQPIVSVYEVTVVMAKAIPNKPSGGDVVTYYQITPKIDGNKLILDFAGQEYEPATAEVTVTVTNVMGENGLPALMPGERGEEIYLFQYIKYSAENAPESTDGIATIEDVKGVEEIYNLNGVKVSGDKLTPGIYVINGKKTVVK